MTHVHFVTGGARSGKSKFVSTLSQLAGRVAYYGAAQPHFDPSLDKRIHSLQQMRGPACETFELDQDVLWQARIQEADLKVAIFDCVSLWTATQLTQNFKKYSVPQLIAHMEKEFLLLVTHFMQSRCPVIVVSSDVSAGVIPPQMSAKLFRDFVCAFNLELAEKANTVLNFTAGQGLLIKDRARGDISISTLSEKSFWELIQGADSRAEDTLQRAG